MKILKFGSASIQNAEKILNVADIIMKNKGNLIVLASMRGTAEALTNIARYFYKNNKEGAIEEISRLQTFYFSLTDQLLLNTLAKENAKKFITGVFDYIKSFSDNLFTLFEERIVLAQGELLSCELFRVLLSERGLNVCVIPALETIRLDKDARPDTVFMKDQLAKYIDQTGLSADLYLTQGYICKNWYNEIDDLRKGGSDLTACLAGAALNGDEIQIWADYDIMPNNDPKYIKSTTPVRSLNFDEAAELTYFGPKILHPSSILPAKLAGIPIRLKNIHNPDDQGTLITSNSDQALVKAVGAKDNITVINLKSGQMLLAHGFLKKILSVFENYQTPIDMITTSEIGVSITIDTNRNLNAITEELKRFGSVTVDENMTMIAVIGDLSAENKTFHSDVLDAVKQIPVKMISFGGSNYNLSFLIDKEEKETALKVLNNKLFH